AKSPSGRSTLITRAPASASRQVHIGAATACSSDTTNRPESGRGMGCDDVAHEEGGHGGFAVAHAHVCRPPRDTRHAMTLSLFRRVATAPRRRIAPHRWLLCPPY